MAVRTTALLPDTYEPFAARTCCAHAALQASARCAPCAAHLDEPEDLGWIDKLSDELL